ncbi:MAG: tetratricopeptide repeat protein [Anaerolineales bacterium]|nr:tetratricopeptide repeat protein [Anaerolineales bacterium]
MRRGWLRIPFVFLLMFLAVAAPVITSGYSELRQAASAESYNEIAGHYLRAAQRLPWRADLYELAGHAYFHAEEYALADSTYQRAFEKGALSPQGWMAWGDVNYLDDNKTRAVEIWKQTLEQDGFSAEIYLRLARASQADEDYAAAASYFQSYVSAVPDDASAHYQLGLLLTLTEPDKAASELLLASQLDVQFGPAADALRGALSLASRADTPSQKFVLIGAGLGSVEEWKLARVAFESAVRADDANAEAWAWLGEANQQNGRDGSVELDRALELNPNSSIVRGLRGLHFQRIGNHSAALTEFQAAASLDPENPARFVSLGDAYALTGDLNHALESFQYAVLLTPEDAAYWRALAEFCGRQGIYLDEVGIPAAQRAVTLARDAENLDVLGWLYLLDARYAEAEQSLSDALARDPQNASVYFHLGLLYLQTGENAAAFENLIRARDLGNSQADALLKRYFP